MNKSFLKTAVACLLGAMTLPAVSQTLNDGPIELQVRLRDIRVQYVGRTQSSDIGVNLGGLGPQGNAEDDLTFKVWAQDQGNVSGLGWQGGQCLTDGMPMLTGGPEFSTDFNDTLFSFTYPGATVPQYFQIRLDAWEDEREDFSLVGGLTSCYSSNNRCNFDANICCISLFGCLFSEGDDLRCDANPFQTSMNYRLGPPCQWYSHGYVAGSNCSSLSYRPQIESYWRYTGGTSCANAINLGTLSPGGTISNLNSTECFSNNFPNSPGNDVFYRFNVTNPMGVTISLCGPTGAGFDSHMYLLNSSCTVDTSDDNGCGTQSVINRALCQPGTYYIVVDGNTAADFGAFTITLTENASLSYNVTLAKTDITCFGANNGTITANATGGTAPFNYQWTGGLLGNPVSSVGPGSYSVTVTDARNCVASASTTIIEPPAMQLTATATAVTCGGACDGSANVSINGGTAPYQYLWNSNPPQTFATATLLCPNTYTVTVTDANSCTAAAQATVQNTITVALNIDSVVNVRCFSQANGGVYLTTTGGQSPYLYAWSNSPATEDNPNLGPGTYTLTVTDAIGCTAGGTYVITEPPLLVTALTSTFNPRCSNSADGVANISVNGGVQPYSYLWSAPTNSTQEDLFNVGAATHTVTVTDANSCTASVQAVLLAPAALTATVTTVDVSCPGNSDGSASVAASGGTPGYTYQWSNLSSGTNINNIPAGNVSVLVTDQNGCVTLATGTVGALSPLTLNFSPTAPLCASGSGADGQPNPTVTGGSGNYTYNWSGPGGFSSSDPNPFVGGGTYSVTVNDGGCSISGAVSISAPEPLRLEIVTANPQCQDDSTGVAIANVSGGTSPFSYVWNTIGNDTTQVLEALPRGAYSVSVTDNNGCTAVASTFITDPAQNPSNCDVEKFTVLVPTAFTPNNDGRNDLLVAILKNVQRLEFRVFNRWGQEVYSNDNMQPGDGWDGNFQNKPQPLGTYVYVYTVQYLNGVRDTERGTTTLIR